MSTDSRIPGLLLLCSLALPLPAHADEPAAAATAADAGVATDAPGIHTSGSIVIGTDDEPTDLERIPPDVRARLTAEQIAEIIRRDQQNDTESVGGEIASALVPTVFFATIIGIVVVLQVFRFRRDRQLHETLRAMLDKGTDIPPGLITPPPPNDRRRGIILLTLGIGISVMIFIADPSDSGGWATGLVPAFLGVGYLVAWWLDHRVDGRRG